MNLNEHVAHRRAQLAALAECKEAGQYGADASIATIRAELDQLAPGWDAPAPAAADDQVEKPAAP